MEMPEVLEAIRNDKAKFIGQGDWVKDSAYQVYKYNGKFYSIVVYDSMNCWLMDDSIEEIQENEVVKYIGE